MRSLSINDEQVCLALLEPSKQQGYGGGNINNNGNIMMMIIWREYFSRPLCVPWVAAQIGRTLAMAGQWPNNSDRSHRSQKVEGQTIAGQSTTIERNRVFDAPDDVSSIRWSWRGFQFRLFGSFIGKDEGCWSCSGRKVEGKGETNHTFLRISPSTFFSFSSKKIKYHIKRQISSEIQRILRERKVEMRE